VVAVHGLAGGIKVKALSGDPSGLLPARTLRLAGKPQGSGPEGRRYQVMTARRSGGCAVFSLEGVDSAEAAKELVGARVFVPPGDLPPLEEGEYFVSDLIGCAIEAVGTGRVGAVVEVIQGPAHDWLAIRRDGEGGEVLLPLVSEFVREVDTQGRRIVVTPPEGWPDEG
jgi:16S rRNA processing protein RimM